jgi:hypothetical protein
MILAEHGNNHLDQIINHCCAKSNGAGLFAQGITNDFRNALSGKIGRSLVPDHIPTFEIGFK